MFVPEEEWEKVEREKCEKRLALLRSEAETARLRLELAEVESREQEFARRDLAVEKVQRKESDNSSAVLPSDIPGPVADMGWS